MSIPPGTTARQYNLKVVDEGKSSKVLRYFAGSSANLTLMASQRQVADTMTPLSSANLLPRLGSENLEKEEAGKRTLIGALEMSSGMLSASSNMSTPQADNVNPIVTALLEMNRPGKEHSTAKMKR